MALLAILMVGVASVSTGALAASARHAAQVSVSVSPSGQSLRVTISTRPRATCNLNVVAKRQMIGFPAFRASNKGKAAVRWVVPSDAPSGSWLFRVGCRLRQEGPCRARAGYPHQPRLGLGSTRKGWTVRLLGGAQYVNTAYSAPSEGQAIVNAASSMVGEPYCFDGGNTSGPTHGDGNADGATRCGSQSIVGFDCTGLTIFATGKALAHDYAQAIDAVKYSGGQRIYHESELQPGDLVYFGGKLLKMSSMLAFTRAAA